MLQDALPRSKYEQKYKRNAEQGSASGNCVFIHRPTIDRVEVGMLIRVWVGRKPTTTKVRGHVVLDIDVNGKKLLVRAFGYGTKVKEFWCDVDDVKQVWKSSDAEKEVSFTMSENSAVSKYRWVAGDYVQ